jgi:thiamine pyrophosphate-dependent acetolactate synthase large subunit-like protein
LISSGPVLIDFPIDILFSPVHQSRISWGAITSSLPYQPAPNPEAVAEAISLLQSAKRPAIIVGTGARSTEVSLPFPGGIKIVLSNLLMILLGCSHTPEIR